MAIRVGIGYDSHRLVTGARHPGRTAHRVREGAAGPLRCRCGRPRGHRCDLGAAAAGDMGALFPDTDPKWQDADSLVLLRLALRAHRPAGLPAGAGRRHHHLRAAPPRGRTRRPWPRRSRASWASLPTPSASRPRPTKEWDSWGGAKGVAVHRRGHGGGALIESLLAAAGGMAAGADLRGDRRCRSSSRTSSRRHPPMCSWCSPRFLTHRGDHGSRSPSSWWPWGFGVAGAVLVYWASRRFGRRFFSPAWVGG